MIQTNYSSLLPAKQISHIQEKSDYKVNFGRLHQSNDFELLDFSEKNLFSFENLKRKIYKAYIKTLNPEFYKTIEGKRRLCMQNEDIKYRATEILDKIYEELEIPKDLQPKFKLKNKMQSDGEYNSNCHTIFYNPQSYLIGNCMETILMHEATHAKEAIKRSGIPQERINKIAKDELISRIYGNENEKIWGFGYFRVITPPKMSYKMQKDFAQFAQENLYDESSNSFKQISALNYYLAKFNLKLIKIKIKNPNIINKINQYMQKRVLDENSFIIENKLKIMLKNHPEFIEQYKNEDEALKVLVDYSLSHWKRYYMFTHCKIRRLYVPELQGEELKNAEKSLRNWLSCMEGNLRKNVEFDDASMFQYEFCDEEVLAETNGEKYLIKTLNSQIEEMKLHDMLLNEDETFLKQNMEIAKLIIEYREKGLKYYKLYTKCLQNGKSVNELVEKLNEIENLKKEIETCYEKIDK